MVGFAYPGSLGSPLSEDGRCPSRGKLEACQVKVISFTWSVRVTSTTQVCISAGANKLWDSNSSGASPLQFSCVGSGEDGTGIPGNRRGPRRVGGCRGIRWCRGIAGPLQGTGCPAPPRFREWVLFLVRASTPAELGAGALEWGQSWRCLDGRGGRLRGLNSAGWGRRGLEGGRCRGGRCDGAGDGRCCLCLGHRGDLGSLRNRNRDRGGVVAGVATSVGVGVIPGTGVATGSSSGLGVGVGRGVAPAMADGVGVRETVDTGTGVAAGTGRVLVGNAVGTGVGVNAGVVGGIAKRVSIGCSPRYGITTGKIETSGTSVPKRAGVGVGSGPLQAATTIKSSRVVINKLLTNAPGPPPFGYILHG